jgi:virulence factor Mce-like protein
VGARVAAGAGLVIAVVAVLVLLTGGGGDRTLRAAFDSAVQVTPTQEVRIGGRKVGTVSSVEEVDGQAIVKLSISDGGAWPLHRGTTARLRWGSTSGYALRYVELRPGPKSAPALKDDGLLPRVQTTTPVELDRVYRIFRGRGRADLGAVVDELSATFGPRAKPLARALRESPAGLDQLAEVLDALGADERALRTLVVAGDRTASALAAREGQLGEVVGKAAQTFDEVATRAAAVRASLERLPATLDTSRSTLKRLDGSLVGLQALVGVLGPGATELRRMAPAARDAFAQLRAVAPLTARTLRRGTNAAPGLTRLLRTGTPFLPRLGSALDRFAPMAGCLRPYGPELAGFLSTWIGYTKNYDAQGHNARILVQAPPVPVGSPLSAEQAVKAHGGALHYAMPRPPGLNAGQPWFQPQCGAGPDALDPAKDPERKGATR